MDYSQIYQAIIALAGGVVVCLLFAMISKKAKERNEQRNQIISKQELAEQYKLYLDKAMEAKSHISGLLGARFEQNKYALYKCLYNGDLILNMRERYVSDKKKFRDVLWALQLYITLFEKYDASTISDIQKVSIDDDFIEYIFDYYRHFDFKLTHTKSTLEELKPSTGVDIIAHAVWLIQIYANEALEIKKRYEKVITHITNTRTKYNSGKFDYDKAIKEIDLLVKGEIK